jgi:hypothetical protein
MVQGEVHVMPGMEVVGWDNEHVGTVKAVRARDFLLQRRLNRDLYVPLRAIRQVQGAQVMLIVGSGEVDTMNWPCPPLL